MSENPLFSADHMKNLDDYASAMVMSMLSIRTLEGFQAQALKLGILQEDEEECSKTIIWELRRLLSLYKTQMDNVLERTDINPDDIVKNIQDKSLKGARKLARGNKVKDGA